MVSNIDPRTNDNECMDVCIYDCMQSNSISQSLKKMICSFVKASDDFLNFQIVNVAGQTNTNDCGVYALAYTAKIFFPVTDLSTVTDLSLSVLISVTDQEDFRGVMHVCTRSVVNMAAQKSTVL